MHLSFCKHCQKKTKYIYIYLQTEVHIISDKWGLSISSKMKTRPVLTEGNKSWLNPRFGDNSLIRDLYNEILFSMLLEHFPLPPVINVNVAGEVLLLCIILFTYYIYITKTIGSFNFNFNSTKGLCQKKKKNLYFIFFQYWYDVIHNFEEDGQNDHFHLRFGGYKITINTSFLNRGWNYLVCLYQNTCVKHTCLKQYSSCKAVTQDILVSF